MKKDIEEVVQSIQSLLSSTFYFENGREDELEEGLIICRKIEKVASSIARILDEGKNPEWYSWNTMTDLISSNQEMAAKAELFKVSKKSAIKSGYPK
ncbi:hypothetical protein O9G_000265 [Rozella allomycis CSF55]|uniref:Mediator of RNA polymerase II transcription subunit 10 n=1 Tax=Rozella allomycis (strain CSF55) TaxID=988480 RepID=A0A075AP45_ROZAC|nr:hypothetical protein O9G_000265 [Rozella allomycis CSF55]|eukprot:EPZ31786.1 hypothetical protein O9G_000265 [Rozella allomycis CSF55]